ncbi:hypothetical protein V1520DRAFT_350192 [Lipomyces starkeyi]|uniref:Zn(2)-C6 fungal-type domain-containing protein n=1 Tax=Lipomyces starkeyi NRRL Y-11557 TaxID=675824 RepID=A0A1E3Q1E1_LIPST|nr:hypothetical protein LIPSTDRAFT_322883 [Lipomyces starkeyi NRRL Y-11557]
MSLASIHPSQRRFSCEVCRKHKSRCQRLNRYDPKCARCTLLGVECTTGQQRNIGRPRRAAPSNGPDLTVEHPPAVKLYSQPIPPSMSQENATLLEGGNQLDWTSMMSPAPTAVPVPVTTVDNAFGAVSTRSTIGMDSFDQYSPPWDTGFGLDQTDSFFNPDSGFSITTPTPYSIETPPKTVSAANSIYFGPIDKVAIPGPETADGIDTSDAIFELSNMNLDLHIRVAAAEMNKATLDFNSIIYQQSALYIDNFTLAEFMLKTSQDFLLILTRLLSSRPSRGLLCASRAAETPFSKLLSLSSQSHQNSHHNLSSSSSSSYPIAAWEPLSAPLSLTVTSIFTQLVSLYELILHYIAARVERIATDPIAPIPGLTFGGLPLENPCTQGMLFSEVIVHLLERIERALGIVSVPDGGEVGLLSVRQIEVLWSELDGRRPIIPGHSIMGPAKLRRLFGKVAFIFKQLSLGMGSTE